MSNLNLIRSVLELSKREIEDSMSDLAYAKEKVASSTDRLEAAVVFRGKVTKALEDLYTETVQKKSAMVDGEYTAEGVAAIDRKIADIAALLNPPQLFGTFSEANVGATSHSTSSGGAGVGSGDHSQGEDDDCQRE